MTIFEQEGKVFNRFSASYHSGPVQTKPKDLGHTEYVFRSVLGYEKIDLIRKIADLPPEQVERVVDFMNSLKIGDHPVVGS